MTVHLENVSTSQACLMYADLTGRTLLPRTNSTLERIDDFCAEQLSRWHLFKRTPPPSNGIEYHRDGRFSALEVKEQLELKFKAQGLFPVAEGRRYLRFLKVPATGAAQE
jgi:hypothetical protein